LAISKLEKLLAKEGLTEQEVITALKGARKQPPKRRCAPSKSDHIKYLCFYDAHIGHKEFQPRLMDDVIKRANQEKADFVVDIGDRLEGMSGRPGHIYELTHQGFSQQFNYAKGFYNQFNMPIFGIDGNHDQWYFKKNNGGLIVGQHLQDEVKNYTHLGQDEGWLDIGHGNDILLFHPNDGTAYATSYKLQKLVESFTGGEKPSIVHSGHYHKAMYAFIRNVHGFESGTLCGQSQFMRGKKIPAHMGYWVIDVWHNKRGIKRIVPEFVPHYND
jgi:hypothetical protein